MVSSRAPAAGQLDEALNASRTVNVFGPRSFSLRTQIRNIRLVMDHGDLIYTMTQHRVRVRYKQSMLGIGWAVFQPLALMAVYTVIFSMVAKVPSDGMPYAVFAFAALLPWSYFSTALTAAAGALVSHRDLITRVYFPREILPLTYALGCVLDLAIGMGVLGGLMLYHRIPLSWNVLFVFPLLLLMVLFTMDLSLILSSWQVRFRDIGLAMPLLLQLWMFATPVVYPLRAVPARLRWLYDLNPLVGIVENFRRVLLLRQPPDASSLLFSAVVAVALFPAGYALFKYMEADVADRI
jgi:lipopolysaccharide transport system permease protein